jgi:3-oxoacyl-[acyl-carrier-protein] synthase II
MALTPRRRVAVTGLGAVTPLGQTMQEGWNALLAGRSGAGPITRIDATGLPVRFACEVKGFDPARHMEASEARATDLFSQFAMAAAVQAVRDACLSRSLAEGTLDRRRVGVLIGAGCGGIGTLERAMVAYLADGPEGVAPFFPMFMANAPSALVATRYGFTGASYCTMSACATSAHALGQALRLIQRGAADVIVAGGAEAAITPLAVAGFASTKALSERNDDPQTASRPFDRDRDGFVMGEGAAVAVLEEWGHAQRRGARIYAEMAGYGLTADAYHITAPDPDGAGATESMRRCLADAGVPPEAVGYINAHGTSTPHGDAAETAAVKAAFGEHAVRLVLGSTKSMTGHLLGAAGALEFAVCALAVRDGAIPPTINRFTPDPACDLDCAPDGPVRRPLDVALSNSFGFGGHNVTLAVRRAA